MRLDRGEWMGGVRGGAWSGGWGGGRVYFGDWEAMSGWIDQSGERSVGTSENWGGDGRVEDVMDGRIKGMMEGGYGGGSNLGAPDCVWGGER